MAANTFIFPLIVRAPEQFEQCAAFDRFACVTQRVIFRPVKREQPMNRHGISAPTRSSALSPALRDREILRRLRAGARSVR